MNEELRQIVLETTKEEVWKPFQAASPAKQTAGQLMPPSVVVRTVAASPAASRDHQQSLDQIKDAIDQANADAKAREDAIAAAAQAAIDENSAAINALEYDAPEVVATLPTLPDANYPSGKIVWNQSDGQLYRSTGSTWVPLTVDAPNISGILTAAQIASLAASQITGQLTDAQIASITAAKLTGQISSTQIADDSISTPKLAAGAVSTAELAAGAVTAEKIAADSITATKIAAGAVEAAAIAAGAIQTASITAAAVTADKIAANAVTADKIAGATITGDKLAANTITAGEIAAGAIGADQIAANAIVASKLTLVDTTNLCQNPSWDDGFDSWNNGAGTYATTSTAAKRNSSAGLVIAVGCGTSAVRNLNDIPVNVGDVYYAEAWFKSSGLTAGAAYVRIRGNNSSGTEVWTPTGNSIGNTSGVWTRSKLSATIPSYVATINLEVVITGTTAGSSIYGADCFLRRQADASMIVDGTITGSKIAASTITADKIDATYLHVSGANVDGTVAASDVVTGTVTADQIIFQPGGEVLNGEALAEMEADCTANHLSIVNTNFPTSQVQTILASSSLIVCTIAVTAQSTTDMFLLTGVLGLTGTAGYGFSTQLLVDGSNHGILSQGSLNNYSMPVPFSQFVSNLSAGTHTLSVQVTNQSTYGPISLPVNQSSISALQIMSSGGGFNTQPIGGVIRPKPNVTYA